MQYDLSIIVFQTRRESSTKRTRTHYTQNTHSIMQQRNDTKYRTDNILYLYLFTL
jgi:hypothetical protein